VVSATAPLLQKVVQPHGASGGPGSVLLYARAISAACSPCSAIHPDRAAAAPARRELADADSALERRLRRSRRPIALWRSCCGGARPRPRPRPCLIGCAGRPGAGRAPRRRVIGSDGASASILDDEPPSMRRRYAGSSRLRASSLSSAPPPTSRQMWLPCLALGLAARHLPAELHPDLRHWPDRLHAWSRRATLPVILIVLFLMSRRSSSASGSPCSGTSCSSCSWRSPANGELARAGPTSRYLTEFYLLLSVGGVLGRALQCPHRPHRLSARSWNIPGHGAGWRAS